MTADHSITTWIRGLKGGDEDAAAEVWNRFFHRVCGLASQRLGDRAHASSDHEDVALSAMNALYRGAREGRFQRLEDRSDLWDVVAMITVRKSIDARRKRSVRVDLASNGVESLDVVPEPEALNQEYLTALCSTGEELVASLPDELRPVALMRFEGYSNGEIARHIERSEPTVERYLKRIRLAWQGTLQAAS